MMQTIFVAAAPCKGKSSDILRPLKQTTSQGLVRIKMTHTFKWIILLLPVQYFHLAILDLEELKVNGIEVMKLDTYYHYYHYHYYYLWLSSDPRQCCSQPSLDIIRGPKCLKTTGF